MLTLESISKYYDDIAVLSDITCTLATSEVIGLLGLNGAGKSTLLRILVGSALPSYGTVTALQSKESVYSWQKKHIGYLPDKPPLYPDMKVHDYLTHVARLRLVPKAKLKDRLADVTSKLELQSVTDKNICQLSHGFKQRVGIAQAIIHQPKLVVLDEPIQGLDPLQIKQMRAIIADLGREFCVILSSHILSEMTQVCDRAFILHGGKLIQELDFKVVDRLSLEEKFINLLEPAK